MFSGQSTIKLEINDKRIFFKKTKWAVDHIFTNTQLMKKILRMLITGKLFSMDSTLSIRWLYCINIKLKCTNSTVIMWGNVLPSSNAI